MWCATVVGVLTSGGSALVSSGYCARRLWYLDVLATVVKVCVAQTRSCYFRYWVYQLTVAYVRQQVIESKKIFGNTETSAPVSIKQRTPECGSDIKQAVLVRFVVYRLDGRLLHLPKVLTEHAVGAVATRMFLLRLDSFVVLPVISSLEVGGKTAYRLIRAR